jgi:hypothetical protein
MLFCDECKEEYDLSKRLFFLYSEKCDVCRMPKAKVYFSTVDQILRENEVEEIPQRGKCPCGGWYQDWHSHASDCDVINDIGKDYSASIV